MSGHGNHTSGELGRLSCANRADNMLADHDSRIPALETGVAARQLLALKNQPNGYAGLGTDGKLPASLMPAATPTGNSWEAANQTAMLALSSAVAGDIAWREDTQTFWQLKAVPYSTLANWKERVDTTPGVTAINSTLTGNVLNVQLTTQKNVAGGYAGLGSDGKVLPALMPADSGIISHINEYHRGDIRRFGAVINTDCTNAIIAALLEGQSAVTAGQKFQNGTTGAYQGGSDANGGCDIEIPIGTWFAGNLNLSHRAGIGGKGQGSILKRLPGTTGDWIKNRRDGSVHAKYCNIHDLKLHGNWNAASAHPTGTAVKFLGEEGYTSAAYTNPLDEDYDEHHGMWNVHIVEVDGDALRVEGSGEFKGHNITIRTVSGLGIYTWQDNQFDVISVGHTGKQGILVAGDKCALTNINCWYNGEIDISNGKGIEWTASGGSLAGAVIQDTYAQGLFFNGAKNVAVSAVSIDSASKGSPGTYAALDIYGSYVLNFSSIVARNRYRTDGSFGPNTYAVKIGGSSHHLYGDIAANLENQWGMNGGALFSGSKAGTGSRLFVNDTQVANS